MRDITGLTGVAAQEAMCVRPGYWVVEGWEVRKRSTRWWQGTCETEDGTLMIHGETLGEARQRIAEKTGRT